MKIIISTINSKYIHINNSVYILDMYIEDNAEIVTYTLKDNIEDICNSLIVENADYYFFSVYIWNIELYKKILPKLRQALPNAKITIGGPEVSYDSDYMLENVDYIYRGETNESVNEIISGKVSSPHIISKGYKYSNCNYNDYVHNIEYYNKINLGINQIVYIETSKGCPFKCSYCMSSLENLVCSLELEEVYKVIDFTIDNDIKTVKFLDRTFNFDEKRAMNIMDYIAANAKPFQVFQFEVAPELISQEFLDYLENVKPIFRFEVGIQSVHNETVNAVNRYHKYSNYENILKALSANKNVTTHFDLIAGLPYETYEKFKISFNTTFKILPDEYQLGMLKVLNGTKIKSEVELHQIVYDKISPYQFIQNKYLTKDECNKISLVEDIVDRFYNSNRFNHTFRKIVERHNNVFDFLLNFNLYLKEQDFKLFDYQLYDIFKHLYNYLLKVDKTIADFVIYDYIVNTKNKPKKFYETIDRKAMGAVLKTLVSEDKPLHYLYKYVIVEELVLDKKCFVVKDLKTLEVLIIDSN